MTFTKEKIEESARELGITLTQCEEGETPCVIIGDGENKTFISYNELQDDFRKNFPITKESFK